MQVADTPNSSNPPEVPVCAKPANPPQKNLNHPIFVAKHDYSARREGNLGFKKGDLATLCHE